MPYGFLILSGSAGYVYMLLMFREPDPHSRLNNPRAVLCRFRAAEGACNFFVHDLRDLGIDRFRCRCTDDL